MAERTDRSLQMLATALEQEERGRDFYKEAVSKCKHQLGKEIFTKLMVDEGVHIVRCKEIYADLSGGRVWSEQWKSHRTESEDLQLLCRKRIVGLGPKVQADSGDLDAVKIGLEMEQGAINFYEDQLGKATESLERDFINCMIMEERSHYAALADIKFYFENPESWFVEHERHTLDGA